MDPSEFKCPHCGAYLAVKRHLSGKFCQCPMCACSIRVPYIAFGALQQRWELAEQAQREHVQVHAAHGSHHTHR